MDNKKFSLFLFLSLLIVAILLLLISSNVRNVNNSRGPVIRLKGARYVEVSKGSNYVEPGYIAIDQNDGDITSQVVVKGNINTKKLGVYELEYEITNSGMASHRKS